MHERVHAWQRRECRVASLLAPLATRPHSQHVALAAVQQGRGWVDEQIGGLAGNRAALLDALSPLGASNVVGGEGAIYFFAKLPEGERLFT